MIDTWNKETLAAWHSFVKDEKLSEQKAQKFMRYMELLTEWNAKTNITRIVDPREVINFHFRDSLALTKARDLALAKGLCDVGSGGGFPGIPLAICYPHLLVILLEVSQKKRAFLTAVVEELQLPSCQVMGEDFLTFVRTTNYPLDFFVARASLKAEDLVRALTMPAYQHAEVVYWASRHWQAEAAVQKVLCERFAYELDGQQRFLAFFKR